MPFYSKDWRSPGEEWVKTGSGCWETKRVLENMAKIDKLDKQDEEGSSRQPHCHITVKSTREIAGFNTLNDVVKRLDFQNAVRDVRRFNYICALLELLVGQQTTRLSGCTQRTLLAMLEEVAAFVAAHKHSPRTLRNLLVNLRALITAEQRAYWGGPLGSKPLWTEHAKTINRILQLEERLQVPVPPPLPSTPEAMIRRAQRTFDSLPEECKREIMLRLSDHADLVCSAQSCNDLQRIVDERRTWRELTSYHFTAEQIASVRDKTANKDDWQTVYFALKRVHGIKEDYKYAEMLSLCRHCCCLFWCSIGHPCIVDHCPEYRARLADTGGLQPPSPVLPADFLKFFSL